MESAKNKNINLNNESCIFMSDFNCGKTQSVEMKVGRKTYLCDISKDMSHALIEVYRKLNKNRQKYSKYDAAAETRRVTVKADAILRRDFFESIADIEKAQFIIQHWRFKGVLE